MSQSPTINGLESPLPPSPFHIDATPPRPRQVGGAEQINLFFSPANSEAPSARGAVEGSYIRHKSPPQVYTRTARARAYDDDDDEEEEDESRDREGELPLPDPKRQRHRAGASSVAGRHRAVPSAQNQASALALFDNLDPLPTASTSFNNRNANANGSRNGQQETLFDPLMGPVGMMEDDAGGSAKEGEEGKKRSFPKMDVERLLGDRGFPALIKDAKRFRVRGKGHEAKDLANLLSMYQLWAHQMYPKMTFGDTVTKVETLCGTKLAKSALSRYRERDREMKEALFRDPTPPLADSTSTVPFQDRGDRDLTDDMRLAQGARANSNDAPANLSTSNGAPGDVFPSAGDLHEADEDEDYEAMIAAAEAEAEEAQRELASTSMRAAGGGEDAGDKGDEFPPTSMDEQEMMMGSAQAAAQANAGQAGQEDYEDDWAAMDGM